MPPDPTMIANHSLISFTIRRGNLFIILFKEISLMHCQKVLLRLAGYCLVLLMPTLLYAQGRLGVDFERKIIPIEDGIYAYEGALEIPNEEESKTNSVRLITLINPKIQSLTKNTETDWEGCLSVPGLRGKVTRPNKIKYSGLDLNGNKIETIAEGFHARVVQHECDHLFGILYPQRMKNLESLQFVSEARHWS